MVIWVSFGFGVFGGTPRRRRREEVEAWVKKVKWGLFLAGGESAGVVSVAGLGAEDERGESVGGGVGSFSLVVGSLLSGEERRRFVVVVVVEATGLRE